MHVCVRAGHTRARMTVHRKGALYVYIGFTMVTGVAASIDAIPADCYRASNIRKTRVIQLICFSCFYKKSRKSTKKPSPLLRVLSEVVKKVNHVPKAL